MEGVQIIAVVINQGMFGLIRAAFNASVGLDGEITDGVVFAGIGVDVDVDIRDRRICGPRVAGTAFIASVEIDATIARNGIGNEFTGVPRPLSHPPSIRSGLVTPARDGPQLG